jgi:foldase protein PrsA
MRFLSLGAALLLGFSSTVSAQSLNGASPAATVNGETITVDDWIARLQNLRYQDFLLSSNPLRIKPGSAGQIALEGLINTKLVMQYAKKVSLLPSDAEIDAAVKEAKLQPSIIKLLETKAITEEALREDMRRQRALFNVATINKSVTPDEVSRFYAAHPERYGQREEWKIGVIRLSTKANADRVAAELKSGKSFESVASGWSEDPDSKRRGGELGTFAAADPSIPAFIKDAVNKMKVGEVSPLLTSNTGAGGSVLYFYIKLLDKKEQKLIPFDQVKAQVERAALFEKSGGGAQKVLELQKDAVIVINIPGYQDMFKKP